MQTFDRVDEGKLALKVKVIFEGQGHFFTLAHGRLYEILRCHWAILNKMLYVSFQVQGNEILCTWCWSHDQDGHHAHIW